MKHAVFAVSVLLPLLAIGACGCSEAHAIAKAKAVDPVSEAIDAGAPDPARGAIDAAAAAQDPPPQTPSPPPPAPPQPRPAWTVSTTLAHPPVDLQRGVAGVVAHVPAGFDPAQPLHLVLFFHGSGQCVAQIALSGPVVCRPGARPRAGAGLVWRHDDAGTNTVFVAPQFILWGGGTAGKLTDRGFFRAFVEEILRDTLAPGLGGPRTLDDVADITIVAHSAGHMPLTAVLDGQELDDKVKNVVLLDALYDGRVGTYVRWVKRGLEAGQARKLVAIYGEWGRNPYTGRTIAARVEGLDSGSAVVNPPGPLADAIRAHAVTVAKWNMDHARMVVLTMSKVLAALDLPARAVYPPRQPGADAPDPALFAVGERITGALDVGDPALENGALFDDYALDLDPRQALDLDLRGGWSKTDPGCNLDVFLELLKDGQPLAHDDDGSGGFDAHLQWTAAEGGRYVVRVSTSGSGAKRGGYTLSAD